MKPQKSNPLKILFVSAEVAPFAKVGGLGDVAGALPQALKKLGADIRIMMPLYGSIKMVTSPSLSFVRRGVLTAPSPSFVRRGSDTTPNHLVGMGTIECSGKKYPLKQVIKNFDVEFDGKIEKVNVYETVTSPNPALLKRGSYEVPVYFIETKKFFGENEIYGNDEKFLFFSKAVADIVTSFSFRVISRSHSRPFTFTPDIIHCNDNHTALIPVLLKSSAMAAKTSPNPSLSRKENGIKTVLTIHNLEFQGKITPNTLKTMKLDLKNNETIAKDAKDGDINRMVQGILLADAITSVSPTYAKEILTKEYGEGLENILKMREKKLYGIINGIDIEQFNPETDPFIKYNYSTKNLAGKIKCKEELIGEYFGGFSSCVTRGLTPLRGVKPRRSHLPIPPLIGLVSRLAPQKGIDLIIEALPKLFKTHPEIFFILLGTGTPKYEKKLQKLGEKYPDNFKPLITFDIKIAQQIYAASDIFLMPSKFEPCGLGQLIAMRYGAVPVARKTGGLADTVVECRMQNAKCKMADKPNGFLFKKYSSDVMLKSLNEALAAYKNKRFWKKIMLNGMRRDSSWQRSARKYLEIYKNILN